ncbi:MAG: HAD-IIB family hydrolase [Pseudomonadota bacterium]|nr:HAD-IIB family hydrolase [Pseudomonadota bacterium]
MTQVHPPLLIFSDLDGTLLDHESYDWSPARPALERLARMGGGVVLATSKTAAEVVPLRDAIGLSDWPAIVENGAGILEPGAKPQAAPDYDRLRAALEALPADLRSGFTGFGDLDAAGVADVTGLTPEGAALAKTRAFSEPGTWRGDEDTRAAFVRALADQGITARMGGRFLTLSFGRTKADAMAELISRFAPRHTMALGDAPNDAEMIEAAEIGVIIPNPHGAPLPALMGEADGRVTRTRRPGPEGWNLSVGQVIDELELSLGASRHG